jgi:hypothetical protein
MIGAHNSKTIVVVPVVRVVVVAGPATQILRFVVPRTAAQSLANRPYPFSNGKITNSLRIILFF